MAPVQNRVVRVIVALAVTAALVAGLALWQPSGIYLWLKALHVIAIIAWMAGMLYLPRLFVYHCGAPPGSPQSETFKVMERRLLKVIINPAMVVSWALGLWLGWRGSWLETGGLHAKIILVLLLSAFHRFLGRWVWGFDHYNNRHLEKIYCII